MKTPLDSTTDQDESGSSAAAAASFAHSLAVAPLDTASTIHNISLALNSGNHDQGHDLTYNHHHHDSHHNHHQHSSIPTTATATPTAMDSTHTDTDVLMTDVTNAVQSSMAAMEQHNLQHESQTQQQQQPVESRIAVAELLVSLAQNTRSNEDTTSQDAGEAAATAAFVSAATGNPQATTNQTQQSPLNPRIAVDYLSSVKKAYENNPQVYTEFLSTFEQYRNQSMPTDQLVRTVMTLFQDQPDLLLGFKEFLPGKQELLSQLVPPMMYSDYKRNAAKADAGTAGSSSANKTLIPATLPATSGGVHQSAQIFNTNGQNGAAADFLSLIKERSQQEPDMYQHLITLLRKFQKDHNYSNLYFYVSIILRYHPHLLQRFHKFLPSVVAGVEVTEPRVISKAPPEELVVSPDFIEAKDFVQTVKYEAKSDLSMYDRFIFALEKYQCNGWTLDQVYSEVSLIFWNHPDALIGFKQFISSVPPPPAQP
ncbi:Transcriptional regulatory protein sin3 [Mortierella claussenii]|nr:Transcriptional regulatory protein sin3 [Mortierella claussenii]